MLEVFRAIVDIATQYPATDKQHRLHIQEYRNEIRARLLDTNLKNHILMIFYRAGE
jgi:hypothetical protein